MNTRMTKYYEEPSENASSRYVKNAELYKEISKNNLENYDIQSNATVIGPHENEIDVEKIKKILDTKYNEAPKRKSIRLEEQEEKTFEREATKEYDINVILEKAREQKEDNYDEERLKKLRDTQYDILNNLNIVSEEDNDEKVSPKEEDDDLKKLINTIALNETKKIEDDSPLDILSDLKGSENTETLEGLKEKIESIEEEEKDNTSNFDTKMINSFYTSSNALKEKDFEEIDDFSDSIESNNIILKIIIALVIIVFLVGLALIIKSIYFS
jgi:hypothetical protein